MKIGGSFSSYQKPLAYPKKKNKNKEEAREVSLIGEMGFSEEDSKNQKIAFLSIKLQSGQELSKDELDFLDKNAPSLKSAAMEAKEERNRYRKSLERCKSKEEASKLKLSKELDYFIKLKKAKKDGNTEEVNKLITFVNTIQNEHNKFIKTEKYGKLPDKEEKKFNNSSKYINHINDKHKEIAKKKEEEKKKKEEKMKNLGIDIGI